MLCFTHQSAVNICNACVCVLMCVHLTVYVCICVYARSALVVPFVYGV